MTIRRISIAELVFGEPLRWDIFSTPSAVRPLLCKGQVLQPGQLDGWLDAALYAESAAPVSVLHGLNQINRRLERVLLALREQTSADKDLRAIAQELIATVERDADIALAAIFLNQIVGAYAVRHCTEVAIVACLIARAMDKSPAEVLIVTAAALTMNVGMVHDIEQFERKDCALTPDERAAVRRHPWASVEMLRFAGVDDEAWLDLVMLHHENADGSGYPEGRLGDEITQNAKLIGLADRYCAFVSARNYRRSLLPPVALARLHAESAMPFDQLVIGHFEQQLGAFPPGTLVRLRTGDVAVVKSRCTSAPVDCGHMAHRQVYVLRSPHQTPVATVLSTRAPSHAITEALHEDDAGASFSMRQVWGELASI